MPTAKQSEIERAQWERLRQQVRAGDQGIAADKADMKAQIMAYLEEKVDRRLKGLRDGQALAIVFRLEVVNSDFSFRGEPSARNAPEYGEWRDEVYRRDGYACVDCGATGDLQAHHIEEWARCPERRFDVENGQTLCIACHEKRHPHIGALRARRKKALQK